MSTSEILMQCLAGVIGCAVGVAIAWVVYSVIPMRRLRKQERESSERFGRFLDRG